MPAVEAAAVHLGLGVALVVSPITAVLLVAAVCAAILALQTVSGLFLGLALGIELLGAWARLDRG